MKNIILTLFFSFCTSLSMAQNFQKASYKVDFGKYNQKIAKITATLPLLRNRSLSMITRGDEILPEGEAGFVQNLTINDLKNKAIPFKYLGEGEWKLEIIDSFQTVQINYEVRLEHDKYAWENAGGIDGVSYLTSEGAYFSGYTLFLYADFEQTDVEVEFILPANWKATTPWLATQKENTFKAKNSRFLLKNCFFVGTHHEELLKTKDFELKIVIGQKYVAMKPALLAFMRQMLESCIDLFGDSQQNSYLIVINEGKMNDGEAFYTSFSQTLTGEVNENGMSIWAHIMGHEIFHLWNGLTIIPAQQEEWFKEGFTDYMTNVLLARKKILPKETILKCFEHIYTKYVIARMVQNIQESIKDAGEKKGQNRLLVYGGGELFALALEVEMREATQNQKGVSDLMQTMYQEFGKTGKKYTLTDIQNIANRLTNKNLDSFFARYLTGKEWLDITPYCAKMGLQLDTFVEEAFITIRNDATENQKAMRMAVFGF
jgi:predicted metalloprotease with PDZ domain